MPLPRASFTRIFGMGLVVMALHGCGGVPPSLDGAVVDVEADSAIVQGAAADATTSPDGRPYQFRAVCLEAGHESHPFVLSKWADDVTVVRDLGLYHADWKAKGHHWVIQRRTKP